MAAQLAPYIALPGTAAEAFRHWHEVLGGEVAIMTYGDAPLEGMPFEPDPDLVAHATLETPGGTIAGGDAMGDDREYPIRDTAYSLLYTVDTEAEARELFQRFLDGGGSQNMPLERAPWGDWYGQVFDRFGVMWAINAPGA
ncbi:VOC family protein [Gulosibacter sp. 10]|uniref:VOC family protein n=1 Tax=Gulosibacter sp. 10 TaxID=1255570 RepID=UPI00097EF28A|nr:VOC family protein [Gulosibacter sp. 10]SJM50614.1 PhnB protein; putative DNA binding 3-demethylubiquinone-9 3-methyltransferase domain protein [Gulosibacter sp. 10]